MATHPTDTTLRRFWIDHDRHRNLPPCRPNLTGQVQHPRPQVVGVLDPVPRAVAEHDEPMRRANPQFFLYQQEVTAHLCPVRRPDLPRGFPLLWNNRSIRFDEAI